MSTPVTSGWRDVWSTAPAQTEVGGGRTRLEVVPTRSQRRARPRAVYAVLAVGTVMAIVVAQLLLSIMVTKGAYALDSLQTRQSSLQREYQSASEHLDQAASPQNLAAKAAELGMVANPNLTYLRLSDGKVLGHPAPAPAAGKAAKNAELVPNALLKQAQASTATGAGSASGKAGNSASTRAPKSTQPDATVPFTGKLPSPTTH